MKILLGVTGGIAAYKTPTIISVLRKYGHFVKVCATKSALNFVTEMSLSTMSGKPIIVDLEGELEGHVTHIDVAHWCDVFAVVPATANFIAKMAHGIADDALSTIHLALPPGVKKRICPAMNTNMFLNPLVKRNIRILEDLSELNYQILPPVCGRLACGSKGEGKLPETKEVVNFIENGRGEV